MNWQFRFFIALGIGIAVAPAALAQTVAAGAGPSILRLDPRFDDLVPRDAVLEKIASGFAWVEGPVWHRQGGYLLFSDIPENAVYRWNDSIGVELVLKPSGYSGGEPFGGREPGSNGLAIDPQGRLVLCQHGDRRIIRLEPDGSQTTLADRYAGRRLNSPNDAVFHSNGDLYFTDPPFGLPLAFDDPQKELPFQGVYRLDPEGNLSLLTSELEAPNGIAFAPSERTLYLSNADPRHAVYMAFEVRDDGTLGAGRVFFDATAWAARYPGAPDGLKVDRDGNLFAAGPGGIYVFAPDGTHLGGFTFGRAVSNSAWGGDGHDLYITAGSEVYRVRLATRGAGF